MASVDLNTNGAEIQEVYNNVIDENHPTNWMVLGYAGKSETLKVRESGDDGLEGFAYEFEDSLVLFGFAQVTDPNTQLKKHVYVVFAGEGAPTSKKGLVARHSDAVSKVLRGAHVVIQARSESDIEPEAVLKKVESSSGANYSFHKEKAKPANPRAGGTRPVDRVAAAQQERQRQEQEERARDDIERNRREASQKAAEDRIKAQQAQAAKERAETKKREDDRRAAESRKKQEELDASKSASLAARKAKEEAQRAEEQRLRDEQNQRVKEEEASRNRQHQQYEEAATAYEQPAAEASYDQSYDQGYDQSYDQSYDQNYAEGTYAAEEYPAEEYPAEEYPAEEYPAEEYPAEEYPAEEYPAEEYPAEEYPAEEYPAEEYPAEEYPAEEYPAEGAYEEGATAEYSECTATVLYDYEAADESELTLIPGEIIYNITTIDEGWWEGDNSEGVHGMFPSNYVELAE